MGGDDNDEVNSGAKNRLKRLPAKRRQEILAQLTLIAETVQKSRRAKGLTQEQLAEKLDVASKTIQSIELQTHVPSLPLLIHICAVLDIKLLR